MSDNLGSTSGLRRTLASTANALRSFWSEQRGLIVFIVLMTMFRSSIADWNTVPTSSMRPTIIEGDRVLINKVAYDLQIPFLNKSVVRFADPDRGDIVVIKSKSAGKRLIKRVVGVPGDRIQLRGNRLQVNDQRYDYHYAGQDKDNAVYVEMTDSGERTIRPGLATSASAFFPEQLIPEGHYMVLGDNRGNSADSRYIGFVPRDEIIGRSRRVVLSFDRDHYYLPRGGRVWDPLDPVSADE